ncbi:MAG: decarboxylating 6-phosphogluconate dehydrogenase [Candidatus Pacebacteria bacterium]|nr:decarboxylating 6-phosphogluconate dehydrogenase [Candidatus Paceibacterota bacterium]
MKLGYIGLGKMGMNMVLRLHEKGQDVVAYNRSEEPRKEAREAGVHVADSYEELVKLLPAPRTIWVMVPNNVVDSVIAEFLPLLSKGDTIIDGGNSFYKDSVRRGKELTDKGFHFMDIGTSGGPGGARNGACLMIGGEEAVYKKLVPLFKDISAPDAYQYLGRAGAGHFVKMVHNGIEYGMMQSLAEGFAILEKSDFNLDLPKVTEIYNHRSVIESRLVGWLADAYKKFGKNLDGVSATVSHTGEGEWTVNAGKELGIPVKVIEDSFKFRVESGGKPSYIGKVLSALRNQFGGHSIGEIKK